MNLLPDPGMWSSSDFPKFDQLVALAHEGALQVLQPHGQQRQLVGETLTEPGKARLEAVREAGEDLADPLLGGADRGPGGLTDLARERDELRPLDL